MHACMSVCIYVCMCMYECMYECIYESVYIRIFVCICVCNVCMHVCAVFSYPGFCTDLMGEALRELRTVGHSEGALPLVLLRQVQGHLFHPSVRCCVRTWVRSRVCVIGRPPIVLFHYWYRNKGVGPMDGGLGRVVVVSCCLSTLAVIRKMIRVALLLYPGLGLALSESKQWRSHTKIGRGLDLRVSIEFWCIYMYFSAILTFVCLNPETFPKFAHGLA